MKIISFISFVFYIIFSKLMSFVPFKILYILSDMMYPIVYWVIRYRRKVVRYNLTSSFPNKSKSEIIAIEKKYYRHLCDITLESFKTNMPKKTMKKRYKVLNRDKVNNHIAETNKSILVLVHHYNNWEWGTTSAGFQFDYPGVIVYHKISNFWIDKNMKKSRSKRGTIMVPTEETSRTFKQYVDKQHMFYLVADQYPTAIRFSYWEEFLGKETSWFSGPEIYSRKYNIPTYILSIKKVKRGYYELYYKKVSDSPKDLPKQEITRLYVEELEKLIMEEPAYWIWSHKRWKSMPDNKGSYFNPYDKL
ncbi:MAG: lysophospholipid acyltransferase family protein [Bacteroidales bacterium]